MKKKPILILLVLSLFLLSIPAVTYAGEQDFTLINQTGKTIVSLYIAPSNSKSWGYDLIEGKGIPNNGSRFINFPNSARASKWDIWVKYSDGSEGDWSEGHGGFNLKEIDKITLKSDGYAYYE